jgi:hypothetical protein
MTMERNPFKPVLLEKQNRVPIGGDNRDKITSGDVDRIIRGLPEVTRKGVESLGAMYDAVRRTYPNKTVVYRIDGNTTMQTLFDSIEVT